MTDALAFARRSAALIAADSEHLPRVLDITALGARRELVLQPVTGPTLADVLTTRRRLATGEAVTVMIGAVRAIAALHATGYCAVSLTPDDIRFDADARPILLGTESLHELIHDGADAAADDWRAVAALADRMGLVAHGRTAGGLGPAQLGLGLAFAAVTAGENATVLDQLEDALFELAEPQPVRLDRDAGPVAQTPASPATLRKRGAAAHRRPSGSVLIEAFDAGPAALLAGPLDRLASRARGLAARLTRRGRALIIGGGLTAALTVVAVIAVPGHDSAAAPTVGTASATAAPSATVRSAASTGQVPADDDPVAAARDLLAERDACLGNDVGAETACLSHVADASGAALAMPHRALAGLTPSLLERNGDSALIALTPTSPTTTPASALLMRTEAGWKLRQLYEN